MSQPARMRLYASPMRRLIWILLAVLLLRALWFYWSNDLHLAALIAGAWFLFALTWVVNLFRIPIAMVSESEVTLLERLRFGRPNFLTVRRGQLAAVTAWPRGRLVLDLEAMGERTLTLKYLRERDRTRVLERLQAMAEPYPPGTTEGVPPEHACPAAKRP